MGDVTGLEVLYERYYGAMVALGFSIVGEKNLAEDIAQEVFAVMCRDLKQLNNPDQFGAWLGGICRNLGRQALRIRSRRIKPFLRTCTQNPQDANDRIVQTQKAILALSKKYREVIALRYYDNLPYDRIGAILGLSLQGVNGRLMRAKRNIEKILRRQGLQGGVVR